MYFYLYKNVTLSENPAKVIFLNPAKGCFLQQQQKSPFIW